MNRTMKLAHRAMDTLGDGGHHARVKKAARTLIKFPGTTSEREFLDAVEVELDDNDQRHLREGA